MAYSTDIDRRAHGDTSGTAAALATLLGAAAVAIALIFLLYGQQPFERILSPAGAPLVVGVGVGVLTAALFGGLRSAFSDHRTHRRILELSREIDEEPASDRSRDSDRTA